MAAKSGMGRPRTAPAWESKMHYRLTVMVQDDRDVHTALFEAGERADEFLISCVRHYLKAVNSPALDPEYQNGVIAKALLLPSGINGESNAK